MGLKDYRMQLQSGSKSSVGATWAEPFRPPLRGVVDVNGESVPVIIERPGDLPGASDVLKVIDGEGTIKTVKEEHVRVTAVPQTQNEYLAPEEALSRARRL